MVVGIGTEIISVVFNDNKQAITRQTTAYIDYLSGCDGLDGLTTLAGNIDPFIMVYRIIYNHRSRCWPNPSPYPGFTGIFAAAAPDLALSVTVA